MTVSALLISFAGLLAVLHPQSDFSRGYGTVLDSGTTFTYLPSSAYKAFLTALDAAIQPHNLQRATGKDPSVSLLQRQLQGCRVSAAAVLFGVQWCFEGVRGSGGCCVVCAVLFSRCVWFDKCAAQP